jgi:hypothetical protein
MLSLKRVESSGAASDPCASVHFAARAVVAMDQPLLSRDAGAMYQSHLLDRFRQRTHLPYSLLS